MQQNCQGMDYNMQNCVMTWCSWLAEVYVKRVWKGFARIAENGLQNMHNCMICQFAVSCEKGFDQIAREWTTEYAQLH